jgi:hypothetical protein
MHGVRASVPAIGFSILPEVVFRRTCAASCSQEASPLYLHTTGSGRLPRMPPSPPFTRLLVLMPAPMTKCLTNYWGCKPSVFSTRATNSSAPSGGGRCKVRAAVATRLMHPYRRVSQGLDLGLSRENQWGRGPFGSAPATKCLQQLDLECAYIFQSEEPAFLSPHPIPICGGVQMEYLKIMPRVSVLIKRLSVTKSCWP